MNTRIRLLLVSAALIVVIATLAKRGETQGQTQYLELRGNVSTTAPTAAAVALGGLGWQQGRVFLQINPDGTVQMYTPQ